MHSNDFKKRPQRYIESYLITVACVESLLFKWTNSCYIFINNVEKTNGYERENLLGGGNCHWKSGKVATVGGQFVTIGQSVEAGQRAKEIGLDK